MTTTYLINIVLLLAPVIVILYVTFHDKIKRPLLLSLIGAVGLYVVASYAGSVYASLCSPSRMNRTIISTISVLCGAVIFYSIIQYRFCQCIFIITIIKCFVDDVTMTASVLHIIVKGFLPASFSSLPVWPVLIIDLVTFPLIYLFYKKLLRPVLDDTEAYSFWNYIWIIPLCSNTLYSLCIAPHFSGDNVTPAVSSYFIPLFWIVLSFATFTLILQIVSETRKNFDLQSQLHISDLQMSAQQKQIEMLQDNIERNSRARHDMRHHMLTLQTLLSQKDYAQAIDYLAEYSHQLETLTPASYTRHPVLNAILAHYSEEAAANDIRTSLELSVADELPVSNMDLCIILGNLLENAVEACRRQIAGERFITLHMTMTSPTMLVLIIENSYSGVIKEQNDTFLSSKQEGRTGMGINSVRHLVKQYHGVCKIDYTQDLFKVKLLLNKAS